MKITLPGTPNPTRALTPPGTADAVAGDPSGKQFAPDLAPYLDVEVIADHVVEAPARGTLVETRPYGAEPDDVLELNYEGGLTLILAVDQYREDIAKTRGTVPAGGDLEVQLAPPTTAATRGWGDWVLKGVKLFRPVFVGWGADAAQGLASWKFESKLSPPPGLYRLDDPRAPGAAVKSAAEFETGGPALIFLHGTMSSIAGSFGELATTAEWTELQARYGRRIYGFQHKTLTESPVDNACALAELLPRGARVHFVSHSRGGLVGELLCLEKLEANDISAYADRAAALPRPGDKTRADAIDARRKAEVERLKDLSRLLVEKELIVERFVRVACPARGTVLASERLDLFASLILSAIGFIPGLKGTYLEPVYAYVKAVALELAKRRLDPTELPGIEAQIPASPLVHLLNRPGRATKADLGVIAGDIEGEGLVKRLAVFFTDTFYLFENHDLVVDTDAMYGGMIRPHGAWYFFDQGPGVSHFKYFKNELTRARMLAWLSQPPGEMKDANFVRIAREGVPAAAVKRSRSETKDLPVVFLLPGIMGSHLADDDGPIWMNYERLALGGMGRLEITAPRIKAAGIVAQGYQALADYLGATHEVVLFAYDWRRSVLDSAAELARAVQEKVDAGRVVRLLAHSMGGLVARAMIAEQPKLWDRLREKGGRLVMLGTPNRGSYVIPRLLFGVDETIQMLKLLDPRHNEEQLAQIIAAYPGALEMLPEVEEDSQYFFTEAAWKGAPGAAAVTSATLKAAAATREKLTKLPPDEHHRIYGAGAAPATPARLVRDAAGAVTWQTSARGDGTVPWSLGLLEKVPTYFMEAAHGELASHAPAFPALHELLTEGATRALSTQEPALARALGDDFATLREPKYLFPTEEDLVASALRAPRRRRQAAVQPRLHVRVAHGDLRLAEFPLVVGHYLGDSIVHAEAILDRQLGGKLQRRLQMDSYPGPEGSVAVVLDAESKPPGGIVVGLGEVGEIKPEKVRRAVMEGARRYAIHLLENPCGGKLERRPGLSALLLGSYGNSAVSIADSVEAIVTGVLAVNRELRKTAFGKEVQFETVEIVECFETVAAQAVYAGRRLARRLPANSESEQGIDIEPYLKVLPGGRFLPPFNQYESGWWRRIQVTSVRTEGRPPSGDFNFVILTDRARVEEQLASTQAQAIDGFVADAIRSTAYDETAAATLFEMLVPAPLKRQLQFDGGNVALILDRESARLPWEMLARRSVKDTEPLGLRFGLLRQFKTFAPQQPPPASRLFKAVVIGDTQNEFAELPGAQREAESVGRRLAAAGFAVAQQIRPKANAALAEIMAPDFRILHLAAHGLFDESDPKRSGVVLGHGTFLTTGLIRQMPAMPELVFINCCHLGQFDRATWRSPNRLAASVAEEMIALGVRAVVAAGWAVDDQAAGTFAGTFYDEMLAGETFGKAVLVARQATHRRHPTVNTWGAYQCYGAPDFRLELPRATERAVARGGARESGFCSRSEYLFELRGLVSGVGDEEREKFRARLTGLENTLPRDYQDGEMLYALAEAWAALGEYEKAIENYRAAGAHAQGLAPLRAIEQLANRQERLASKALAKADATTRAGIEARRHEAAKLLEQLLGLAETSERHSLLGGMHKRLIQIYSDQERALAATLKEKLKQPAAKRTPEEKKVIADAKKSVAEARDARKAALLAARDAYHKAHRWELEKNGTLDPYPATMWITCRLLLGEGKTSRHELENEVERIRKEAAPRARRDPRFFTRIQLPDALLLDRLIKNDLAAGKDAVIAAYKAVLEGGYTAGELSSVTDHHEFLIAMLTAGCGVSAETIGALTMIRDALLSLGK